MKDTAEDAGWKLRRTVRETAWDAEERVLWRGTDAARATGERALKGMEPLQRLIQTKLAWPVADAWRDGGTTVKAGLATAAVAAVAAVAATSAGGAALAGDAGSAPVTHAKVEQTRTPTVAAIVPTTLNGVNPDFTADKGAGTTVAAQVVAPAQAPPAPEAAPVTAPEPGAPPDRVAKAFAEAFVRYEVGKADEATAAVFSAVAEKPLARTLEQDPPRLPAGAEVPEAEVLNVVLAEPDGKQVEASVSLSRMEAASELRLTLQAFPDGWQVVEVRG